MTSKKELSAAKKAGSERGVEAWKEWKLLLDNYPLYDQNTIWDRAGIAKVVAVVECIEKEKLTNHQLIQCYAIAICSRSTRLNLAKSEKERKSELAKKSADRLHSKPGGSREKRDTIRNIWASGKYISRDICADQEWASLDMSPSVARKALRNTPAPNPWPAKEQKK